MKYNVIDATDRCKCLAEYIIKNNATVRKAAAYFGISKSTVHKDVSVKLKKADPELYKELKKVIDKNKSERHIRGGIATRNKYEAIARQRRANLTPMRDL